MEKVATRFLRHICKSRIKKSVSDNIIEVENVYNILSKPHLQPRPRGKLYHVVISKTNINNAKQLNFWLTNLVFNQIHKQIKDSNMYINYLFVLEYPSVISTGLRRITSTNLHAHLTINTNIPERFLECTLADIVKTKGELYMENITDRLDKEDLAFYLTKQSKCNFFLTHDHFNYKVDFRSGSSQ